MATPTWAPKAPAIKQISTITVALAWAAGDIGNVTINGKILAVTVGATGTSVGDVAISIRDAIMASSRLTGVGGNTDNTSNFGGQEFGEFAEIEASILDATPTVVTLIARKAGKPFTFSVSETTAGTGTLTAATTTAASGPNFWNDVLNWDTGVVPATATTDDVVFRDSSIPCLYGLPNGTLEITLNVYQSFTGTIGLPIINVDNPALPYYEYRQRYVRLDDAGLGTSIAHRFGLGTGNGSNLINVKHSTLECKVIVYGTGTPQVAGTKALNLCLTASTSELTILKGSVDCSSQDGSTSALVLLNVGYTDSQSSDSDVRAVGAMVASSTVIVSGGRLLIGGTPILNKIECRGGIVRVEEQSGTIAVVNVFSGGIVTWVSSATITQLRVDQATFDVSKSLIPFTITAALLFPGTIYNDPYSVTIAPTDFKVYAELDQVKIKLGGASASLIQLVP